MPIIIGTSRPKTETNDRTLKPANAKSTQNIVSTLPGYKTHVKLQDRYRKHLTASQSGQRLLLAFTVTNKGCDIEEPGRVACWEVNEEILKSGWPHENS